jgi:Glyoxalase-like domain
MHLDVIVDDLDTAGAAVLALGATKHEHQPGTSFRAFLDPAGHPCCLYRDMDKASIRSRSPPHQPINVGMPTLLDKCGKNLGRTLDLPLAASAVVWHRASS